MLLLLLLMTMKLNEPRKRTSERQYSWLYVKQAKKGEEQNHASYPSVAAATGLTFDPWFPLNAGSIETENSDI